VQGQHQRRAEAALVGQIHLSDSGTSQPYFGGFPMHDAHCEFQISPIYTEVSDLGFRV